MRYPFLFFGFGQWQICNVHTHTQYLQLQLYNPLLACLGILCLLLSAPPLDSSCHSHLPMHSRQNASSQCSASSPHHHFDLGFLEWFVFILGTPLLGLWAARPPQALFRSLTHFSAQPGCSLPLDPLGLRVVFSSLFFLSISSSPSFFLALPFPLFFLLIPS